MSYQVGITVVVVNPTIKNQVGGTTTLEDTVKATIIKTWHDEEIGQRYIGELFREEDIQASKESGKSNFTPEDYKQYGEKMYQDTVEAFNHYNPKLVFFGESAITFAHK